MPETVVKTAKTVELALKAALEELGVPEDRIKYEILEHPSRGLFGILGGKPARVRVSLKEEAPVGLELDRERDEIRDERYAGIAPSHAEAEFRGTGPLGYANEKAESVAQTVAPEGRKEIPAEVKREALQRARTFLEEVFQAMGIQAEMQEKELDAGYGIGLSGKHLGIIIGKHGQTLDALQYLTNLAANRDSYDYRVRIVLDVENYRGRREETLQKLAKRMADRAVRIRQDVKLEPMNRHERKIIHMALQDNRRVTTYSSGEEPYRSLVISPVHRKNKK